MNGSRLEAQGSRGKQWPSAFNLQPRAIAGRWWLVLLGVLTVSGLIKVALAVTLWRSAYGAGQQAEKIHALENDTQWLETQVVALQAPAHLAKAMANERTSFVARVELPTAWTRRLAMDADE